MFINYAAVLMNVVLAARLTYGGSRLPELGFIGCPIGAVITMWLQLGAYYYYMHYYRQFDRRCQWKWSHEALNPRSLKSIVAVGFPLAAGNLVENSQLQMIAVFAVKIGEVQLGTHNSMMELFLFATSPIFGISEAAITRIGKHLGVGDTGLARDVTHIAGSAMTVLAIATSAAMMLFRSSIGQIFSRDEVILHSFDQITGIAATSFLLPSAFIFALMVLEAQARSMPLMLAFMTGSWCVGIPTAYFFGLGQGPHWFTGIWLGMICGYTVTALIAMYFAFFKTDWRTAAKRAVFRSKESETESESLPLLGRP